MACRDIVKGMMLGKGSYGTVYKIKFKGKDMALKVLQSDAKTGMTELGELNYLRIIKHPFIMHCDDFTIDMNDIGIVLQLSEGDLFDICEKRQGCSENFNKWIYQMISAVHFLHSHGLYHCDIKPENILAVNGNAVLSDLGMVGKLTERRANVCQTYKSPQLHIRTENLKGYLGVLAKQSNEFQDDKWALGRTIYLLLYFSFAHRNSLGFDHRQNPCDKPFNDPTHDVLCKCKTRGKYIMNLAYIKNPEKFLKEDGVLPLYIPLLTRLMDPDPEKRDFNMTELLKIYPLNSYYNLADGAIENVKSIPIIFNRSVKVLFTYILGAIKKMSTISRFLYPFNAMDLFYRIFPYIETDFEKDSCEVVNSYIYSYTIACVTLSCKVNREPDHQQYLSAYNLSIFKNPLPKTVDIKKMVLEAEVDIVQTLKGVITRNLVCDYLNWYHYEKCMNWIIENPEKYQQNTPESLAKLIKSL